MSAAQSTAGANVEKHKLFWLFSDAVGLFHLGRKSSSLLLLLCAVDALAKEAFPKLGPNASKERFTRYLKEHLPKQTRVQNLHIRVPKKARMLRLEEILYCFLRCPMVHEGAQLDMRTTIGANVLLDWQSEKSYVKVDDDTVILGANGIIRWLFGVVHDALKKDLRHNSGM
jgi:hypothetical protein